MISKQIGTLFKREGKKKRETRRKEEKRRGKRRKGRKNDSNDKKLRYGGPQKKGNGKQKKDNFAVKILGRLSKSMEQYTTLNYH